MCAYDIAVTVTVEETDHGRVAYIKLCDKKSAFTYTSDDGSVLVDYDENGDVIGIELLNGTGNL